MPDFDEIDMNALRYAKEPPLELCMAAAAKQLFLIPSLNGWHYDAAARGFTRDLGEEVWLLYGDMRGYPQMVTFCGCEIDGRYDHWEDRTFYRVFVPEDCSAPEVQALLKCLQTLR